MPMGEALPLIIESTPRGDRMYDVITRLLRDRIVFLKGAIDEDSAMVVISQLLYLNCQSKTDDIKMFIMSEGGSVTHSMAIYDTMQLVDCPVATYCLGEACSGAALLLAAGTAGKRCSLPSARIMVHQPFGGILGDNTDVQIHAKEMNRLKRLIYEKLSRHTGRTLKQVEKDCERDNFMSPGEAIRFGLIDSVVKP